MKITSGSVIQINKNALENNISFIQKLCGKKKRISSVLKGNAYGHGIQQMVPLLEDLGIDHFSVFSSAEARKVKQYSRNHSSVMIMGDIDRSHLKWIIENEIECFVFNLNRLRDLYDQAKTMNSKALVHIELETGMNRTGFDESYWDELIQKIHEYKEHITVKGICTHLAGAESISNYLRIQKQLKWFKRGQRHFKTHGIDPELRHASCSAGLLSYPGETGNLLRIGILQYGLWPSKETQVAYMTRNQCMSDPLKRIVSWKSTVMDIKKVKAGEFIGYGMSYLAGSDLRVASIPVGYAHGFSRSLSNQGRVLINGHRCGVIGTVNMNMFLVDVTNANAGIGDEVTLIGNDGEHSITVSYFGLLSDQLNYELLSRIDKDIPRITV